MNMSGQTPSMPGMAEEEAGHHQMSMKPQSLITSVLQHATSGTDAEPNSTPFPMLMTTKGNWTLMFHGEGFLIETQQSGPRGGDKLFSTNWWMPMAQRKFGKGTLTLRTMLSFEPATVSDRRYPELFQEGETAFGRPIVDGQHPHDFFMELAALYDYKISDHTLLSVYAAPMGDPAMGPVAILIGLLRRKIPSRRWDIISRTPRTLRRTSLHWASLTAVCGWKPRDFMDASPTSSAGTSTPGRWTRGRHGSPPIPARTGACNIPLRSSTARRSFPR